jgi:hypothetical protein
MGMRVRLIKKLANAIDGIDLAGCSVGDVLNLPRRAAQLLIAEDWAVAEGPRQYASGGERGISAALDRPKVSTSWRMLPVEENDDLRRLFGKLSLVRTALPRRRRG